VFLSACVHVRDHLNTDPSAMRTHAHAPLRLESPPSVDLWLPHFTYANKKRSEWESAASGGGGGGVQISVFLTCSVSLFILNAAFGIRLLEVSVE
jgi:hypothetical protein